MNGVVCFSVCVPFVMTRIDPCVCIICPKYMKKTEKNNFDLGASHDDSSTVTTIMCERSDRKSGTMASHHTQREIRATRGDSLPSSLFGYYNIGCRMEK